MPCQLDGVERWGKDRGDFQRAFSVRHSFPARTGERKTGTFCESFTPRLPDSDKGFPVKSHGNLNSLLGLEFSGDEERFLDNTEQSRYFLSVLSMDAREAKGGTILPESGDFHCSQFVTIIYMYWQHTS